MRLDRPAAAGALLGVALFVCACASGGATSAPEPTGPTVETAPDGHATAAASTGPAATLLPGALTIVALGDSLTAGDCDDSGLGGYPGRLQALIDPLRPGTRVSNLGHSGWTSGDLANVVNDETSEIARAIAAHPNVALVWIGSNDLWALYEYGPEPMTAAAESTDLADYETNVDQILSQLTSHGATVFVALLDDQSKRPTVAHPNPAEPAFPATTQADLARMSAHIKAYNELLRRKAAQYNGGTVDFSTTKIFTQAATLCDDGNHPNPTGYDQIAAIWFAALQPHLG
jgi:lysophospholipase L1-like esterase